MNTFCENLKQARIKKCLTQKQLADKLGINKQAICNYEKGRRYPEFDLLCSIADILETSVDYLLGRAKYERIELVELSQRSGFSVQAINKLDDARRFEYNHVLSRFFESSQFLEFLKYSKFFIESKPVKPDYRNGQIVAVHLDIEKEKRGFYDNASEQALTKVLEYKFLAILKDSRERHESEINTNM